MHVVLVLTDGGCQYSPSHTVIGLTSSWGVRDERKLEVFLVYAHVVRAARWGDFASLLGEKYRAFYLRPFLHPASIKQQRESSLSFRPMVERRFRRHRGSLIEQPDALRHEVLRRDGWRCQLCGTMSNLEVHHKEFRSHSGDDSGQNLITLCKLHAPVMCTAAEDLLLSQRARHSMRTQSNSARLGARKDSSHLLQTRAVIQRRVGAPTPNLVEILIHGYQGVKVRRKGFGRWARKGYTVRWLLKDILYLAKQLTLIMSSAVHAASTPEVLKFPMTERRCFPRFACRQTR